MKRIIFAAAALMLVQVGFASKDCRFAPSYSSVQLANDPQARNEFFQKVISAEKKFIREVGVDKLTGLTVGAVPISTRTGIAKEITTSRSSLQNEAIHIALLAKSLIENTQIYSSEESLDTLRLKMQSLAAFTGRSRLENKDKVIYWSVYGLLEVLETQYPLEVDLIQNCKSFIESIERFVD